MNDQLALFAVPATTPRARRGDPQTSHDAAASVTGIRESQMAILRVLANLGGLATDEAIAAAYATTAGVPRQSPSGLRTRRAELTDAGYVRDSFQRVLLTTGRHAIVWELVTNAQRRP